MKILLFSRYGRLGASSRLRFFQYLPYLMRAGFECTIQPFFSDAMLSSKYEFGNYAASEVLKVYLNRIGQMINRNRFDLQLIEKEALPWLPAQFERWLLRGVPYVLDYDDALFHNYDLHSSPWVRRFLGKRLDKLMSGSRLVIVGNDYLAKRARDAGAPWVEVLPTVIDLDRYVSNLTDNRGLDAARIVWIGSPSTAHCLKLIHKPLLTLGARHAFKLRVIGARPILPGVDVEYCEWSETTEVSLIQGCDIGVMPLNDLPWEHGKCGYKLIQYMACGLPVVASPVGVNTAIVRDGINGYLASSEREWAAALETLLRNDVLRQRMGSMGRQLVEAEYCVQNAAPRLIEWLRLGGLS